MSHLEEKFRCRSMKIVWYLQWYVLERRWRGRFLRCKYARFMISSVFYRNINITIITATLATDCNSSLLHCHTYLTRLTKLALLSATKARIAGMLERACWLYDWDSLVFCRYGTSYKAVHHIKMVKVLHVWKRNANLFFCTSLHMRRVQIMWWHVYLRCDCLSCFTYM